jgi:hypothetical protein
LHWPSREERVDQVDCDLGESKNHGVSPPLDFFLPPLSPVVQGDHSAVVVSMLMLTVAARRAENGVARRERVIPYMVARPLFGCGDGGRDGGEEKEDERT